VIKKSGSAHRPSVWAGAASIFILLLIVAIRLLGDKLYDFPVNPGPLEIPKNSAIVVLAGGKFRIEAALSLYEAGIGDELFIIGAGKKATPYSLTRVNSPELLHKIPEDRFAQIQVETESRNTIENAFAVKKLLAQKPEVKNIILITSSYHMRRSQFIFENQIPASVKILPFTSPSEAIERSNWWHSWLGIQLTVREYTKFILASFVLPKIGDVDVPAT
jgi:uncharacterized SAM-binding protein YcdF (DUF218 family)